MPLKADHPQYILSTAGFKHNLCLLTTCVCCLCTCTCIDGDYREVLHIYALAVNILKIDHASHLQILMEF